MPSAAPIWIKPFARKDQAAVKSLILAGLADHWGEIDPALNPDLNDISYNYADALFLVAWLEGEIVGTGALVPRADQMAEIVRMSVVGEMRGRGIGTQILTRLCQEAKRLGFQVLVLETTETWHDVIAFYQRFGFRITHTQASDYDVEVHFALDLTAEEGQVDR